MKSGLEFFVVDIARAHLIDRFHWPDAQSACARWHDQEPLLADDTGRVELLCV